MGREKDCSAKIDGRSSEGRALLETTEIVFRGSAYRLRFPLVSLKELVVDGDALSFVSGDQRVSLLLGAADAKRWHDALLNPKSRIDKLGVKAGQSIALVAVDDEALEGELLAKGAEVHAGQPKKDSDVIFFGVRTAKELSKLEKLKQKLAPAGALWVVRPKGVKTVTEGEVMAAGKAAGLVDVKVVALSPTHTAEKFVIPVAKRPAKKRVG